MSSMGLEGMCSHEFAKRRPPILLDMCALVSGACLYS